MKTIGSGVQDKLWLHGELEMELHKILSEKQNSYQNTTYYSIVHNTLLCIHENQVKRSMEAPNKQTKKGNANCPDLLSVCFICVLLIKHHTESHSYAHTN